MFTTGVTVVTTVDSQGEPVGLTASSFNSVSLDPPLVLWSLSQNSRSMAAFRHGTHYAINVLASDQQALAERFASRLGKRWVGVDWQPGLGGAPLLNGAVAYFECANRSRYVEGDHIIFVGQVEHCSHRPDVTPLLYHGGQFHAGHELLPASHQKRPAA